MRKLIFILLLVVSFSFALDRSAFTLDHIYTGFGYGCQYYNVDNTVVSDLILPKPTTTIISEKNNIQNGEWEYLEIYEINELIYNQKCEPISYPNGSTMSECTDTGTSIKYSNAERWVPMPAEYIFEKEKVTKLRYCANYDMVYGKVAIDVIPSFNGYSYPEYAWWNGSWTYKRQIDINTTVSSSMTDFIAYFTLDTASLIASEKIQDTCADIRVVDNTETTELDYIIEDCNDTNTYIAFRLPTTTADGNDTVYVYYGNSEASDGQDGPNMCGNTVLSFYTLESNTILTDSCGRNNIVIYDSGNVAECPLVDDTNRGIGLNLSGVGGADACYYKNSTFIGPQNSNYSSTIHAIFSPNGAPQVIGIPFVFGDQGGIYFGVIGSQSYFLESWANSGVFNTTIPFDYNSYALYYVGYNGTYRKGAKMNGSLTTNTIDTGSNFTGTFDLNTFNGDWDEIAENNRETNGTISEYRIYNQTLSDDWLIAEYGMEYFVDTEQAGGSADPTVITTTPTTYETVNSTILTQVTSNDGVITAYNLSIFYNNTEIGVHNVTGISVASFNVTDYAIAPLVSTNLTNISYEVSVEISTTYHHSGNTTANHTIETYYHPGDYSYDSVWADVVDTWRNISLVLPSVPSGSPEIANHTYTGDTDLCTLNFSNLTVYNSTCGLSSITGQNITTYRINAAHRTDAGLLYQDYWPNITIHLAYENYPEAVSSKSFMLPQTSNISRETFITFTNFTNGTISGAPELSELFFINFFDEITLAEIDIDSAVATYNLTFDDGKTKAFGISYLDSGAVTNATVKAYPNSSSADINAVESYSKSGYTTRSRYLLNANMDLGELQNINIYLLPLNQSNYAIINVVDNGEAVINAYVSILKYYASNTTYTEIDQRITNSEGRVATYIEAVSYYKFIIYDADGDLLYTSSGPEQFICDTTCEITINVAESLAVGFFGPNMIGICSGNNETNTITYTYSDYTGLTHTINFLAWRSSNYTGTAPVACNYTVSGSSGSYNCVLSGGENLSKYKYQCAAVITASPPKLAYLYGLDFVIPYVHTDWIMVAIVTIIGLGAAGLNPVAGLIAMGLGVGGLYVLGYAPIDQSFVVGLLISIGVMIAFLAPREDT